MMRLREALKRDRLRSPIDKGAINYIIPGARDPVQTPEQKEIIVVNWVILWLIIIASFGTLKAYDKIPVLLAGWLQVLCLVVMIIGLIYLREIPDQLDHADICNHKKGFDFILGLGEEG